ncbi:hypothetical protein RJ639_046189 [Escallonia herrerae]|uniref:RNase H type-1 domain-containing protein n=1 Tax=Escallonia herrerae TaxID=1293975 RepID=A0AA88W9S8_9ASTE|nr:hypothetical protein RJ639_046189 [Escallonia herrerae]
MLLLQISDAVMCRAFPTTLRKAAHAWFKSLQPRSIHSFAQLSDPFQKHFISSRSRRKNSASLLNVVQEKNESLACFLGLFNVATLEIDNLDESVKYTAFLRGLQSTSKFAFSVNKSPPSNMKAFLEKANKYIQAEEYLETHRGRQEEGKEGQKKRSRELTPQGKPSKRSKRDERRHKDPFAFENLTPLNAKPSQILYEIKDNKALQWPDKMRSRPNKKMNISTDHLQKMDSPLYGFSNHLVAVEGIIALPVAIGTPPTQANLMLDFVMVKAIRKAKHFAWTDECQTSFKELKTYLSFPPLLLKPFPGENLFLYLSVTEVAVSAVLVREGDGVQKPIYYVSKVLQDVETRYPKIDRITLAFIISARRLRPYFQSHSIIVITDQPLRKVLLSPEALGSSLAVGSSGAEIILISPEGFTIEYALCFGFQASNNEAEYEALLTGIRLAHALKVDSLSVHSDSQLVVNHVLGDYEARDERMAQYLELVKISAVKFKNFTIHQIPRDQNT